MDYTPQELTGILFYYGQNADDKLKADWERTRVQTFMLINIQLDKKNKLTYDKFRDDIWPFAWEKKKAAADPEAIMTPEQWEELLNKKIVDSTTVNLTELF